ncbi:MAG: sugar phosphate isomerase/epimerase family protein [Anaerolineae bacterium]
MSRSIPIGICVSPQAVSKLPPGFDFTEISAAATLAGQDPNPDAVDLGALTKLQPAVRAFNSFLPGDLAVVGPEVQRDGVEAYVATTIARAAEVGAELMVFGSGRSRRVPEGFARSAAWDQLVWFLGRCGDHAEEHGLTIAIEPLNANECNILTTYTESVELAREVNRPSIKVLADTWHFAVEDEPLDDILQAPEWLAHVHVADSPNRGYPGSGSYPFDRLFAILREIGYAGCVSIECGWPGDLTRDAAKALAFLKRL